MNSNVDMHSHIIDLEIRLTHQEAGLQELSDALIAQQKLMDRLQAELDRLKQQLIAQAEFGVASATEDDRPPHY